LPNEKSLKSAKQRGILRNAAPQAAFRNHKKKGRMQAQLFEEPPKTPPRRY